MMSLYSLQERHESVEFLGVWEEEWRSSATLASQADRYRIWLRAQGCTRDEAAELAARFLAARPTPDLHRFPPPGKPTIH